MSPARSSAYVLAAAPTREPFGVRPALPHPLRVLLVEDDADLREATSALLQLEGLEVSTAENGLEALLRLRTCPLPDVLVLDLGMPVMDGWELRAAQLADPVLRCLPVVVVSSQSPDGIAPDAYLPKPCPPDALLLAIRGAAAAPALPAAADRVSQSS